MDLAAFRAAILEVARGSVVAGGFSDGLAAKVAGVMVRHLGIVDEKLICETGSAYLFVMGMKVRISNHRNTLRYNDINVRLAKRGDEEGCRFIVQEVTVAMERLVAERAKIEGGWEAMRPRRVARG